MAKHTTVLLEDDLDGGKADETVAFAVDGKAFEIDLSAKNAQKLRKAMAAYVSAGRRVGKATSGGYRATQHASSSPREAAEMRAWAQQNGYEIGDRGRIPSDVREAYRHR